MANTYRFGDMFTVIRMTKNELIDLAEASCRLPTYIKTRKIKAGTNSSYHAVPFYKLHRIWQIAFLNIGKGGRPFLDNLVS